MVWLRKTLTYAIALAALCLLPVGQLPAAQGPSGPVVEIKVVGGKQQSDAAIMSFIKTRLGQPYDEEVVKADQKRLLESGRFESAVASAEQGDKGVIVTFSLVERPLVAKLLIDGACAVAEKNLRKELTLRQGDALNPYTIETNRQALLKKYHTEGYHFAEVTVDQAALGQHQVIYHIVEGPRVYVSSIEFPGNTFFTNLKLKITVGSKSRFWPFVKGSLDNEQIDKDIETLRTLYISEGFLEARVGREIRFTPDKSKATLCFLIEQGPRYRINAVEFRGNTVYSDQELARRVGLKQGAFFTSLALRRDVQAVIDAYGEIGFIDTKVIHRTQRLAAGSAPAWAAKIDEGKPALLNLVFECTEAEQYRVGKIDIVGNTVTQERVIRRQLRFFPEQLFNTVAVEESRKRLLEERLFDKVEITPYGKEPGVRDAFVQVHEAMTGEFLLGVGVSSNSGLLGNISFTQRNFDISSWPASWREFFRGQSFKGAGQVFRVSLEPGTEMMRFLVEWTEPYLFDKPYALDLQAYYFDRERENYNETRMGAQASIGHRFTNGWYAEFAQRMEDVQINKVNKKLAPFEVIAEQGNNFIAGSKISLIRDRTDSRWLPTTGDRLRISYEQVYGDWVFGKAEGDYKIYRTVYRDAIDRPHVLSGKLAIGKIFGDAPVFEKYYGGGIGSLRGFRYRGVGPRSPRGAHDPVGGDFLLFAGSEYEFPIIGKAQVGGEPGGELRGVLFVDTGTVERQTTISSYRISVGGGIRWAIPLLGPVPLSLDFGVPLMKNSQDKTQILSFTVGAQF